MFKIFGKNNCPNCKKAEMLLAMQGIDYEKVMAEDDPEVIPMLVEKNLKSFPQIWYGKEYVGGFEALRSYLNSLQ